ncbi:MAG: hypothetical protein R3Y19_07060 [Rikenellaceae bacterium]
MKTRNVLTLIVLSVFILSFSTALSQEKKTRREVKQEIKADEVEFVTDLLENGDFLIFSIQYNSSGKGRTWGSKGNIHTSSSTPYSSTNVKRGVNYRTDLAIVGEPDSVWYRTSDQNRSDIVCQYSNQGSKKDRTYRFELTRNQESVVISVVETVDSQEVVSVAGHYPTEQIFSIEGYPKGSTSDYAWIYDYD